MKFESASSFPLITIFHDPSAVSRSEAESFSNKNESVTLCSILPPFLPIRASVKPAWSPVQSQEDFESCAVVVCKTNTARQLKAAIVRNVEAILGILKFPPDVR